MKVIAAVVLIAAIFTLAGFIEVYRYKQCRKIGFSKLYCIYDIGR